MSSSLPPDDQDARTQRHLACLDTLVSHGMDLANRLHQQATCPAEPCSAPAELASSPAEPCSASINPSAAQPGPGAPPITPEIIALFDQVSRAVRRTILVARKLAEPLPLAASVKAPVDRTAARKRIIREVEDTIHRQSGPRGTDTDTDTDTLQAELCERVESLDLDDDIGHRPVHEIIAEICRDLGVAGDWDASRFKRRTPQDLRTLTRRAAGPTGPARPGPATRRSNPANPAPHGPGPCPPGDRHLPGPDIPDRMPGRVAESPSSG